MDEKIIYHEPLFSYSVLANCVGLSSLQPLVSTIPTTNHPLCTPYTLNAHSSTFQS